MELYTVPEAAKVLRTNTDMILDLIKTGKLRCVKIGRKHLVSEQAIRDFVADQEANHERATNASEV